MVSFKNINQPNQPKPLLSPFSVDALECRTLKTKAEGLRLEARKEKDPLTLSRLLVDASLASLQRREILSRYRKGS